MEFKLNKIDTDIRKKIQEEIQEEKVHSSKGINIKKNLKDEKSNRAEALNGDEKEKRFITIDGIKYNNRSLDIQVEKIQEINELNSKGRILDTTK